VSDPGKPAELVEERSRGRRMGLGLRCMQGEDASYQIVAWQAT
jgi:hypothetical protein